MSAQLHTNREQEEDHHIYHQHSEEWAVDVQARVHQEADEEVVDQQEDDP